MFQILELYKKRMLMGMLIIFAKEKIWKNFYCSRFSGANNVVL